MENSKPKSATAVSIPKASAKTPKVSKKSAVKPSAQKAIAIPNPPKTAVVARKKKRVKALTSHLIEQLHGLELKSPILKVDNSWTSKLVSLMADEYIGLTGGRLVRGKTHIENAKELIEKLDKPVSADFINRLIKSGAPSWVAQKLGVEPLGVLLETFADRSNSIPFVKSLEPNPSEESFYDTVYKYGIESTKGILPSVASTLMTTLSESVLPWLSSYVPAAALLGKRDNARTVTYDTNTDDPKVFISKRTLTMQDSRIPYGDRMPSWDEAEDEDPRSDYTSGWLSDSKGSYYKPATEDSPNGGRLVEHREELTVGRQFMPSVYAGFNSHLDAKQISHITPLSHSLYGSDGVEIGGFMPLCEIRSEVASVTNPDGLGVMYPISGFADIENSGYFIKRGVKLNPINLGGRLSNIASQYNRYRFTSVKLCYCPSVGTTTPGQFAISYVSDPGMYESIPGGTYMDYAAITQTEPSRAKGPIILTPFQRAMDDDLAGIHCMRPDLGRQDELFYCDETVVSETVADARQINQGVFVSVSEDAGTAADPGDKWGTVYIYWTVHLVDPVPLIREAAVMRDIKRSCGPYAYEQFIESISTTATLFPMLRSLGIVRPPDEYTERDGLSSLLEDLKRLNIVPSGTVYDTKVPDYWSWLAENPFQGELVTHTVPLPPPTIVVDNQSTQTSEKFVLVPDGHGTVNNKNSEATLKVGSKLAPARVARN